MQQLLLPSYSGLGSVVVDGMDRYGAMSALEEAGWHFVGDGADADVYLSPTKDRVMKLITGDGNCATILAAQRLPENRHLPKVYGCLNLDDGTTAVETEVLQSLYVEGRATEYRQIRKTYPLYRMERVATTPLRNCPPGELREAVAALINAAADYGDSICWDPHEGNAMIRPGTGEIVLNDLLYDAGYSERSYGSDW